MPSGYTAMIIDSKEEVSFEEFALRCSRAFGAFIHMRDDPADAELRLPEVSDYHPREKKRAEERLEALKGLSKEEIEAKTQAFNDRMRESWLKSVAKNKKNQERYEAMLAKVEAWEPPTPDHQKFKDFMIKQIKESMDWDLREWEEPTYLSASRWLQDERDSALRDIEYHEKKHAKELENIQEARDWATALFNSLKPTDPDQQQTKVA